MAISCRGGGGAGGGGGEDDDDYNLPAFLHHK